MIKDRKSYHDMIFMKYRALIGYAYLGKSVAVFWSRGVEALYRIRIILASSLTMFSQTQQVGHGPNRYNTCLKNACLTLVKTVALKTVALWRTACQTERQAAVITLFLRNVPGPFRGSGKEALRSARGGSVRG